ncbi:sigma-70 family RNA polymerase sigma factor [Candidatus Woesearchaeota archaeon]|nr:sigma-70 family RNA polymerase sigma factor [Candidatus Woesearchaeota archaeon]
MTNKNMVVAVGPRDDLGVRLRTFIYNGEGEVVLEYRSDREHIGQLGDLRGRSLQELINPNSNGQDIYSLSLWRNPVRSALLLRIGDYVVDGIVNRSRNTNDHRSKPRRKRGFYEPDFKKSGFEAEDIHIEDPVTYGESGIQQDTIGDYCGFGRQLTPEQERGLFRRFNWLRYKLMDAQDKLRRSQDKFGYLSELGNLVDDLEPQITEVRNKIAKHNMALVVSMAKRIRTDLFHNELISEGNLALFRCVDRFDYTRGFKFSTYACNGISKAFSRVLVAETKYRGRNPASFEDKNQEPDYLETTRDETAGLYLEHLRRVLNSGEAGLNEIESRVIALRFNLDHVFDDDEKPTLEKVGGMIGVTKERVRQIQNKALRKLKVALEARIN